MNCFHTPVLVEEIRSYLPTAEATVGDFTVGGGGHAYAFLSSHPNLRLIGVDCDAEAIEAAQRRLRVFEGRFELHRSSFAEAAYRLKESGTRIHFILADLGFSSFQIDTPQRGFSFLHEGPLDMRMNANTGTTAAHIVNRKSERELTRIIKQYGEEPFALKIAGRIAVERRRSPFKTTTALAECVKRTIPKKRHSRRIHPATKTFQALRIAVNDEIGELESLLQCAIDLLHSGGRIAVISFHSLEDRPVKRKFREWEYPCRCPTDLPRCVCGLKPRVRRLHRKVIQATGREIASNPRARSAKLRIVEKL